MEVQYLPVKTKEEICILADLASEIWHEHFITILPADQIDYMVDKFQSVPALTSQIEDNNYEYFFLSVNGEIVGFTGIHGEIVGFTGIHEETDHKKLFLSKLYLRKTARKKGYASQTFAFLQNLCKRRNLQSIYLTVNRYNEDTIAVYYKKGFQVIKEQVTDIGHGYVMDDFVMELLAAN